jgi:hypothetical protein
MTAKLKSPTFEEGLSLLLEGVVRPASGQQTGCSREEIAAAEKRLGRSLPKVLEQFYAAFGKLEMVMRSHDRFTELGGLKVADGGLTVCIEHQDQMSWVVRESDLDQDDPPFFQRQPETTEWFPRRANLGMFLVTESAWQLVNGLPSAAVCAMDGNTSSKFRKTMTQAAHQMGYGHTCYVDANKGIVALLLLDPMKAYVAAHDDEALEGLETRTGLEFDWL